MNSYPKCLLAIFAALFIDLVAGHPQCLDYFPPFENSPPHCRQYKPLSCCTDAAAKQVRQRVNSVLKAISDGMARKQCRQYLHNVACTVCSPYAAHVYEAETLDTPRIFPSLCHDYCLEFYSNCYPALFDYFKLNSTGYDENSAKKFCKDQVPSDQTYCYPSVIKGPQSLSICALPIADNLRNPIAIVHSNDQTGRLFVIEQIGVVHIITKDRVRLPTPFLNISDQVLFTNDPIEERGLLGIAFHPNFQENGKFYVYYSTTPANKTYDHDSRVSQFLALNGSNVADISSEQIVVTIPQPAANHNGGQLLFKDDGTLLISLGDGGGAGDMFGTIGNGLDRSTLLGSILRINVSSLPYTIPEDNPFINNSQWRPEIYAYGFRHPWRCSFDRGDSRGRGKGRLFCGDVGQSQYEEIDIIEKGGNYGWRAFEGNECFDRNLCNENALINDTIFPIHAYPHDTVRGVVIGGYVYRGCSFPKLQGLYIFGDYLGGFMWALKKKKGIWTVKRLFMGDDNICHGGGLVGAEKRAQHIISFGEDESGELYILATSSYRASPASRRGVVYQIIEPQLRANPSQCSNIN